METEQLKFWHELRAMDGFKDTDDFDRLKVLLARESCMPEKVLD